MPRAKGNEIELFAAALLRSVEEMKRNVGLAAPTATR